MIDTHIHIVPGVDDGAEDLATALDMAREAVKQGIDTMVVTPHYRVPMFDSPNIDEQYQRLRAAVEAENIPLTLHLGNEIHVNRESVDGIATGLGRTMGSSKYLLMELPTYQFYPYHEDMLHDLRVDGYEVLLAHVERYSVFRKEPERLAQFVQRGFYSQLTARYIVERKTRKKAFALIEAGLIHVVASDAHNTGRRPIMMAEAYKVIRKQFGDACAETLFTGNPRRMIDGEGLRLPEIQRGGFHPFTRR